MKAVVPGGISVSVLCSGARVHNILSVVAEYVVVEASAKASAGATMMEWVTLDSTPLTLPTSPTGVVTSA